MMSPQYLEDRFEQLRSDVRNLNSRTIVEQHIEVDHLKINGIIELLSPFNCFMTIAQKYPIVRQFIHRN